MKKISKSWLNLVFVYNIVCIVVSLFFYRLVPQILCYPPASIDNAFQIVINGLTYTQQYIMIVFSSLFIENFLLLYILRKINKLRDLLKTSPKSESTKLYYQLSQTILKAPNIIYFIQVIVPVIMIAFTFSLLNGDLFITLKVCMLFFSILALIASISYIFAKKTFQKILVSIYNEISSSANIDSDFTKYVRRASIKGSIFLVTIPMFIVTAFLIALTGYSSIIKESGNLTFNIYNQDLMQLSIPDTSESPINTLESSLSSISYIKTADTYFIISPNNKITTSNNKELSIFFTKYMNELSSTQPETNRVYDFYGDDSQGVFRKVFINGEEWTIGIRYNLVSNTILIGLLSIFSVLFIVNIILLAYFANFISNDIKRVSEALLKISRDTNFNFNTKLPVVSNDEIGDLVNAFNQIQLLTKNNIEQIHEKQDMLMEKERLASLGQLIGGIAHNLKTPIMSISGAAEGLDDLIKEYNASIEDDEVTPQDHHDIAHDMNSWVVKIREYTEYMSDVITAVKGQAVSLSSDQNIQFNMDELLKRVNILMKHELKNALISLEIKNYVSNDIYLKGDVNSLVQVINNMISNSIQAYNGKTDQSIFLSTQLVGTMLHITIQDYGQGMSQEVKDKLFKEMITTKGKNGTGLGLFMSYSTVKAHFNGDITFESEYEKGTIFTIILPIR